MSGQWQSFGSWICPAWSLVSTVSEVRFFAGEYDGPLLDLYSMIVDGDRFKTFRSVSLITAHLSAH